MPSLERSDLPSAEFLKRIERVHGRIGDPDQGAVGWFAEQIGRTASTIYKWDEDDHQVPCYAVRMLEILEKLAELDESRELLPASRRKRAAQLADELREIRGALKRHLGGVLETLERGEQAMRRLSGEQKEIKFGDRDQTEAEAREMSR